MARLNQSLIILMGILISATAMAQLGGPQVVEGEYLIKYKDSVAGSAAVRSKLLSKANLKASFTGLGVYQVSMKTGASVEDLRNDPDVEYIEPNYIVYKGDSVVEEELSSFGAVSQDSGTYSQSSANIGVSEAWSYQSVSASSGTIIVAVVDSGLNTNHKVFQPYSQGGTDALWVNTAELNGSAGVDDDLNGFVDDVNGWNFLTNSGSMYDDDGHGTHVSGIVVGAGLNIFANNLEKSSIKIMPLKFLAQGGSGTTANAIKAIYYAVNNGAKVINNSWGGSGYSKALQDAMAYAYQKKVLLVSAAGNYSSNNDRSAVYPSNYDIPSNLAVAATNSVDALASFSNYGSGTVHLGAPGESIVSTYRLGYASMSGTSMAAPLVAGLAALALLEAPNLTGYQVKDLILTTSDKVVDLRSKVITESRVSPVDIVTSAQQLVSSYSYQPSYSSVDRSPASSEAVAGGCGLVKSLLKDGPGRGDGQSSNGPMGVVFGLLLLPLVVWQVLRRRAPESRRRYERFNMNSEIKLNVGGRELVGNMKTISEGGLSFSTEAALEKGGIVTMRVQSPDGKEVIEVQGQVVWSEANKAYGVQFENTKQGALAMIRDWTSGLKNGAS